MAQGDDRLWVFGYGSLIWDPGFDHEERVIARLSGWRRSFCMWSIHHRGTPEAPGLVLALDADGQGHCTGVAYRVPHGAQVLALLLAGFEHGGPHGVVELVEALVDPDEAAPLDQCAGADNIEGRNSVVVSGHERACGSELGA